MNLFSDSVLSVFITRVDRSPFALVLKSIPEYNLSFLNPFLNLYLVYNFESLSNVL